MNHEKTFAAIKKLQEIEIELHRLKNALEMANKREWVGLTTDEVRRIGMNEPRIMVAIREAEMLSREKNT